MKVKFVPQNVEFEIEPNQSVMDLAHKHGLTIKSVCKGLPSCAECRVRIVEGESNVIPPLAPELNLIGTAYFVDQRRLSCQLKCFGDVTVDLTEQIEKASRAAKRPRGKYRVDGESLAVRGSMIEEYEAEHHSEQADEVRSSGETAGPKGEKTQPRNEARSGNQQNRADGSQGGGGHRNHRSRRRRRHHSQGNPKDNPRRQTTDVTKAQTNK